MGGRAASTVISRKGRLQLRGSDQAAPAQNFILGEGAAGRGFRKGGRERTLPTAVSPPLLLGGTPQLLWLRPSSPRSDTHLTVLSFPREEGSRREAGDQRGWRDGEEKVGVEEWDPG